MTTFTVTTARDVVDPGDGRVSLREAVGQANAAAGADAIAFATGLEGRQLDLSQGQLTISDDLAVDGDGNNDGLAVTIAGAGDNRLLGIASGAATVRLDDLVLAGGRAGDGEQGGAILLASGSLLLNGCVVRDNSSEGSGGGIFVGDGSQLAVVGSSLVGNDAPSGEGGAISTGSSVTLSIRNSQVSDNSAYSAGGAVDLNGGAFTMENSVVSGNTATAASFANGGALDLTDGVTTINSSTFTDNQANDGGAIYQANGRLTLVDATLAGNRLTDYAPTGGAIASTGIVDIERGTITGNVAGDGLGGGIWVEGPSQLSVSDSLVLGNTAAGGGPDVQGGIARSNGHNVFGSYVSGAAVGDRQNVPATAVFAATDPLNGGGLPADNGGRTPTVALRDNLTNPALSGASPSAAGDGDQRGVARPQPGPSNPDVGAFELVQGRLSTAPSSGNDVLTGTSGGDVLGALAGNDLVRGLPGDDQLSGNDGSDTLEGGPGNDTLDGGLGTDAAIFADASANYEILRTTSSSVAVRHTAGTAADGSDNLTDVEVARFPDRSVDLASLPLRSILKISGTTADRSEGNAGTTPFTFTVTREGDTSKAVAVNWSVSGAGGSPAAGQDFSGGVLAAGTLGFAAGEASKPLTVNVRGDAAVEGDEGFRVTLAGAGGDAVIAQDTAEGIIRNDDAAPASLSVAAVDAVRAEGDASGTTSLTFAVTLSAARASTVGVAWSVSGDGANPAAATDFGGNVLPSGTLSFAAGDTSETLTVSVSGDAAFEPDEGFKVTLASPTGGATLGTTSAFGTIQNDDLNPITGTAGDDALTGTAFADRIQGLAGNDQIVGGLGNDALDGGAGTDQASWQNDGGVVGVVASLAAGTAERGGERDTLTGIENLGGSDAGDTLTGNDGSNLLLGLEGDDQLFGQAGNDLLVGGFGADLLDGGAGLDRVSYSNDTGTQGLTINLSTNLATRGTETDSLQAIEDVDGSSNVDLIIGSTATNRLSGAGGNDTIRGLSGNDLLSGGLGNDVLDGDAGLDLADYSSGNAVLVDLSGTNDSATRGAENDELQEIEGAIGSGNADTLRGDALANLFRGQGGKDTLTGGAAADLFDLDATTQSIVGANRDVITDFTAASDRLDLATIDARSNTPSVNDVFTLLAGRGAAFTAEGQVRWYQSSGDTFVEANVDANLAPDLQVQLSGLKTLTGADFIL